MYFKRTIAASILLALTVGGLSVFLVLTHVTSLARARFWLAHSHVVIETTQDLFADVQTAVGSERGYVLTGDPNYVAIYDQAVAATPATEAKLASLVADNAVQETHVARLTSAIERRLALARTAMTMARAGDMAGARAFIAHGETLASVGDIRGDVAAVRRIENELLARREADADQQEKVTLATGLALSLLALAGLTAGALIVAGANRRLVASARAAEAARAAREASEALARAIFENAPDYLLVVEVEPGDRFVLTEISPTFEAVLGVPAERLRGRPLESLIRGEVGARMLGYYRRVVATARLVVSRDDIDGLPGGPKVWESVLAPVRAPDGAVTRIIGSVRDITDRVKAEQRLRDSQRMEAVGQLTGGVAHDFNNLLQVIRGNLELIERAVQNDARASQRLKNALHGAERAAQLTRQLLAFARRQPLAPQVINLSRLVSDMAELLRRTLGEGIEVETVVAGGLWNTAADPAQVESGILNLALNARDAMPEGGRLTVEINNASLDEDYARRVEDITPGQYVMLAVSDTGVGMDEATRARVFEPFFTTKSDGKGTGLGLSMVYGFVKQSNGHVQIYSEPGHGTTVKIYLPRSRETEAMAKPIPTEALADGARRVVLVVEDEEAVRAAAVATLDELGYRYLEASDAESALRLVESGTAIDLVFTDVVMPGALGARDFAARVKAGRPNLPILFTSGYTENAIVHHGRLDEGVNLISKPYAKDELGRRLASLLAAVG